MSVTAAASNTAAEHQRLVDENASLLCRVQELEAELTELRDEMAWDSKDDEPKVVVR